MLVNAPADGDTRTFSEAQMEAIANNAFGLLSDCGLDIDTSSGAVHITGPDGFNNLFPASGGALYGRAASRLLQDSARPD